MYMLGFMVGCHGMQGCHIAGEDDERDRCVENENFSKEVIDY
jgi:hypothetical protein